METFGVIIGVVLILVTLGLLGFAAAWAGAWMIRRLQRTWRAR